MTTKKSNRNVLQGLLTRAALTIFSAMLLMQLPACVEEQAAPPDNEKTITFSLNVPKGFTPIASYALVEANENEVRTADIMIFKKTDGSYVSGPHFGSVSGTDVTVRIPNDVIIADNDIEVFANCRSEIIGITIAGNETKIAFLQKTVFEHTGKWSTNIGDDNYKPIPMHGSLDVATSEVKLHRMLARVNVSPALDDFTLTSVHLVNYNTKGYIANRAATDDEVVIPASAASTGFANAIDYAAAGFINNDIYTFEAVAGASDATDTNPCIIIGGTYKGNPNNYYRIDFVQDGTYLKIKRNHSYNFMITAIPGFGYASAEVAFNNLPANVVYDISSWSDNNIVESSGQHLLSVSKSQFNFHSDAKTIDNGDNILTIETDHPQGWTATVVNTPAWLSLIGMDNSAVSGGAKGITPIKLALSANDTGSPRSADIKLVAGNVTYTVRVTQSNKANSDELFPSEASTYTLFTSAYREKIFLPVSIANSGNEIKLNGGDVFTAEFTSASGSIKKVSPVGVGSGGYVYVETSSSDGTATIDLKKGTTTIHTWNIKVLEAVVEAREANSYIVAPNRGIAFPVSQANRTGVDVLGTQLNSDDVYSVELVWTDNQNGISPNSNIFMAIPYGKGDTGQVFVATGEAEGNAVVGIRRVNLSTGQPDGGFLWSWHIWVTDYNPDATPPASGYFMDRNLGALNNGFVDGALGGTLIVDDAERSKSMGLHYQWGRKDPFPTSATGFNANDPILYFGNSAYGSADKLKKLVVVSIAQSTYSAVPNSSTDNNLGYAVSNPHIFYFNNNSPRDWYGTSLNNQNSNLWGGASGSKTVYDPCPPGWRVPNDDIWKTALNNQHGDLSDFSSTTGWIWQTNGFLLTSGSWVAAQIASTFFPASGYRYNFTGYLSYVGNGGYYWSASPSFHAGSNLYFDDGRRMSAGTLAANRANGWSIRCSKE